jgi:thioredoxin 1
MGGILQVQQGEWQGIETSEKPVLVDFWAEWCGPCRMLGPTFEKLAEKYGNEITFAKLNVDDLPDVAGKYGIRSVPTLLLLRQGKVLEQVVGTRSYNDLARILDRHMAPAAKESI